MCPFATPCVAEVATGVQVRQDKTWESLNLAEVQTLLVSSYPPPAPPRAAAAVTTSPTRAANITAFSALQFLRQNTKILQLYVHESVSNSMNPSVQYIQ